MRVVIKVGSSSLFDGEHIVRSTFKSVASQVRDLIKAGHEVVVVSSGAIAVGRKSYFKDAKHDVAREDLPTKQALAAIGQPILIPVWLNAFSEFGLNAGQVLATNQELLGKEGKTLPTLKSTFEGMFGLGAVPIVNENDAIANDEIKVGDNDTLAAHVGDVIGASKVYLLGTTNGIFEDFPRNKKPVSQLLVSELASAKHYCHGTEDSQGTGGALTKLKAAEIFVTESARSLFIASASMPNSIAMCESGSSGTKISFN